MIIPAQVRRSWNKLAFRGDSVYVREIYVNIHIFAPGSFMISRRAFLSFQLLYYWSRIILKYSATYLTKYAEHQQFASVDSYKSTLKLIRWSEIWSRADCIVSYIIAYQLSRKTNFGVSNLRSTMNVSSQFWTFLLFCWKECISEWSTSVSVQSWDTDMKMQSSSREWESSHGIP